MSNADAGLFASIRNSMSGRNCPFLHACDGRLVTYGDMLARSARFANCLWQIGVRPGDRLAVQVEKSVEALLLYLACLRTGAVYLPLNPAYTRAGLEYFLSDAEPACVVARTETESSIALLLGGKAAVFALGDDGQTGSLVERAREMPGEFPDVPRAANDLAAILYTSGTTGRSKGAMLTHDNLLSNARALRDLWRFTKVDVLLHALPIYHTHGLFTATNTILMAGASMVFLARFDVDLIFARLNECTTMMGVPTFYTRLLNDLRLTRETAGHMRLFISGSAPLAPETHRAWLDRTGREILERYGMTETNMITSNPYAGERRAGTVGFPLPDVELRIADRESGVPLPAGEIGVIDVRGRNVCKGYWRKPEQTAEAFRADGFFITGDLGRIDEDGYVQIVGRAKDLVISGGLNVYPREVELEIDAIPGVLESAVIGVPHADLGEVVTAIIVRETSSAIGEGDIIEALRTRLARYKQPRRVVFVEALPRNPMGKVQKNSLREMYGDLFD